MQVGGLFACVVFKVKHLCFGLNVQREDGVLLQSSEVKKGEDSTILTPV